MTLCGCAAGKRKGGTAKGARRRSQEFRAGALSHRQPPPGARQHGHFEAPPQVYLTDVLQGCAEGNRSTLGLSSARDARVRPSVLGRIAAAGLSRSSGSPRRQRGPGCYCAHARGGARNTS